MLILYKSNGGFSNRLFAMTWAEAYAIDNNECFIDISNDDLCFYYNIKKNKKISCITKKLEKHKYNMPLLLQRIFKIGVCNYDSEQDFEENSNKISNFRIKFISGWYFRHNLKKHREYFKNKYSLRKEYIEYNETFLKLLKYKRSKITLIGVHIRRGDYKIWENGAYYFDWSVYLSKILELRTLLSHSGHQNTQIIVFSNEEVGEYNFDENITISREPWFVDHCLMGMCDYLIGPPSTFSMWASFIGGAKLCFLTSAEQQLKLSDFKEYYGN